MMLCEVDDLLLREVLRDGSKGGEGNGEGLRFCTADFLVQRVFTAGFLGGFLQQNYSRVFPIYA